MKEVTHNVMQWEPGALDAFTLIALLQRARKEPNFTMDRVSIYKGIDHSRFTTPDQLINHLAAIMMRLNPPVRVELSDDGKTFRSLTMFFAELNEYLSANPARNQAYYPSHYPTRESFSKIVEEEYSKLMGIK